jgi:phosphoribosylanthranilate isomerase
MEWESVEEAKRIAPEVDTLLLDSGNPDLAVKELGGTGRRHDWRISAAIRAGVDKPIFLAGGLNPDSVQEAIQKAAPFGLDICSGVRREGKLNATLLARFFNALPQGVLR